MELPQRNVSALQLVPPYWNYSTAVLHFFLIVVLMSLIIGVSWTMLMSISVQLSKVNMLKMYKNSFKKKNQISKHQRLLGPALWKLCLKIFCTLGLLEIWVEFQDKDCIILSRYYLLVVIDRDRVPMLTNSLI